MDLDELIIKAQKGDDFAVEEILKRFKPYIIKLSKTIYINGHDMEDLIQIGYVTLIKAIKSYDVTKTNKFIPYATCSIKNNYYCEIRQKSKCNGETSLNLEIGDGIQIIDNILSEENIEASYIIKEDVSALNSALSKLSAKDKEILNYVFFNNGKLVDYAKAKNIKYITSVKRKNSALERLKKQITSIP